MFFSNFKSINCYDWAGYKLEPTAAISAITESKMRQISHLPAFTTLSFPNCENFNDNRVKFQHYRNRDTGHRFSLEEFLTRLDYKDPPSVSNRMLSCQTDNHDLFVKSQSKTLKVLTLFRPPFGSAFGSFLEHIDLPVLTEINLWGIIPSNFHFLTKTPNLKKLYINFGCFEKWEDMKLQLQSNNLKYEKFQIDLVERSCARTIKGLRLKHLEYLYIDFEFCSKSTHTLARWMPNLKVLKTILSKHNWYTICCVWENLREIVCLHGSRVSDKMITGVPLEYLNQTTMGLTSFSGM